MNQVVVASLLRIAKRHKHHLQNSKRKLSSMIPLTVERVEFIKTQRW